MKMKTFLPAVASFLRLWWIVIAAIRVQWCAAASLPIIFVHTSNETGAPPPAALCSIESAALQNPASEVRVYSNGWDARELQAAIGQLQNVVLRRLDLENIFTSASPDLQRWYRSRAWEDGYKYHHLSDGARLALLFSEGGVYMDFDIISVRPIIDAGDFICIENMETESTFRLNNAVMKFEQGHAFVEELIRDFVENFDALAFGQNGPKLVTRVWRSFHSQHLCQNRHGTFDCSAINGASSKVSAMPQRGFYDIAWNEVHTLFAPRGSPVARQGTSVLDQLRNHDDNTRYGVHLWHSLVKGLMRYVGSDFKDCPIYELFEEYCPSTVASFAAQKNNVGAVDISMTITFPFAGHQYNRNDLVKLALQINTGTAAARDYISSIPPEQLHVCFEEHNSGTSVALGCLSANSDAFTLSGISAGHHVISAQLCKGREVGDDACDPLGRRGMTAFTVDFHSQEAWSREVRKEL